MSNEINNTTPPDIIAKGGATTTVKLRTGQTEEIKVKLLPLSKMGDFFALVEDEVKLIELATGKSVAFIEALDDDSHLDVLDLISEVNLARAQRWAERRAARISPLIPTAKTGIELRRQLTT